MKSNKSNSRQKTMKISFKIVDEYGGNIKTVNNVPLESGIGQIRGVLNTKIGRKSKNSDAVTCFNDMMRGL